MTHVKGRCGCANILFRLEEGVGLVYGGSWVRNTASSGGLSCLVRSSPKLRLMKICTTLYCCSYLVASIKVPEIHTIDDHIDMW